MTTTQLVPQGFFLVENRVKQFFEDFPMVKGAQCATAPHHVTLANSAVLATNNYCIAVGLIKSDYKQRGQGHTIVFHEEVPEMATEAVMYFLSELEVDNVYDLAIFHSLDLENNFSLFTVLLAVLKLVEVNEMGHYSEWMEDAHSSGNKVYRALQTVHVKHSQDTTMLKTLWSATLDELEDNLTFPLCSEEKDDEEDDRGQETELKLNATSIWQKWRMFMVTTNLHQQETPVFQNVLDKDVVEELYSSFEVELEDIHDYTICRLATTLKSHFLGKQNTNSCGETEDIVASFYELWCKDQMPYGAALASNFSGSVLFLPMDVCWEEYVKRLANEINQRSDQNEVTIRFELLQQSIKATTLDTLDGEDYKDQFYAVYRFNKIDMVNERAGQLPEAFDLQLGKLQTKQEDKEEDGQNYCSWSLKRKASLGVPPDGFKQPRSDIDSKGEQRETEGAGNSSDHESDEDRKMKKEEITDIDFNQHHKQENLGERRNVLF